MATSNSTATKSDSDPTLKEVSIQLEALKTDLANLTEAVGDYGKSRIERTRDGVKSTARATKERTEEGIEQLRGEAAQYAREAEAMVRQQPGAALGIAAGVGFLAGLIVSRR